MSTSTDSTRRPIVIGDVARLAGVSPMTVSRVLSDHRGVRPATRERVLAAVSELGYVPNATARALASGHSRVLAVIGFDTGYYGPGATLLGIEQAARDAGYVVRLATLRSTDKASAGESMRELTAGGVAGFIMAAPHDWAAAALRALPSGAPVVGVDISLAQESAPVVGLDQYVGAQRAVEHLLELGHQTVWHIAGEARWPSAQVRERAWREALVRAGRRAPAPLRGDWSARSGYEQGIRLARREEVTAVFAANDQMALGALRALREAGRDVPGEVSLIGFDDIPEAAYLWPPLTTVLQDFERVGRLALDLLVEQIDGAPRSNQLLVVEPRLVIRSSTATPRRTRA